MLHSLEFIDAALGYRAHEAAAAVDAIRRGVASQVRAVGSVMVVRFTLSVAYLSQVPASLLPLLTVHELEEAICGKATFDMKLWKENTTYTNYDEDDRAIQLFWQVLEEFSDEEKRGFLKFAWGRTRLPTEKHWPEQMEVALLELRLKYSALPLHVYCFAARNAQITNLSESPTALPLVSLSFTLHALLLPLPSRTAVCRPTPASSKWNCRSTKA